MNEAVGGCFPLFNWLVPKELHMSPEKSYVKQIREHLKRLSKEDRLIYLMKSLWGSPYGWGKEQIGSVDCSGALSYCLLLMGFNIRTTADGFSQAVDWIPPGRLPQEGDLIFLRNNTDYYTHVAMFSDRGLSVLTTSTTTLVNAPLASFRAWYAGFDYMVGSLDWLELQLMSESGDHIWGLDPETKPLVGLFSFMEDFE